MKWLKHSIVLGSIIALFVMGFSCNVTSIDKVSTQKQQFNSADSIQSVGLIQTISAGQTQVVVKENKSSFSNFFINLLEKPALLVGSTFTPSLTQQDINRCESVSKLLFPYHFFW